MFSAQQIRGLEEAVDAIDWSPASEYMRTVDWSYGSETPTKDRLRLVANGLLPYLVNNQHLGCCTSTGGVQLAWRWDQKLEARFSETLFEFSSDDMDVFFNTHPNRGTMMHIWNRIWSDDESDYLMDDLSGHERVLIPQEVDMKLARFFKDTLPRVGFHHAVRCHKAGVKIPDLEACNKSVSALRSLDSNWGELEHDGWVFERFACLGYEVFHPIMRIVIPLSETMAQPKWWLLPPSRFHSEILRSPC